MTIIRDIRPEHCSCKRFGGETWKLKMLCGIVIFLLGEDLECPQFLW